MKIDIILVAEDGVSQHATKRVDYYTVMDRHLLEWNDRVYRFSHKIHGQAAYEFVECGKPFLLED